VGVGGNEMRVCEQRTGGRGAVANWRAYFIHRVGCWASVVSNGDGAHEARPVAPESGMAQLHEGSACFLQGWKLNKTIG
jgi:hypothetical protein